MSPRRAAEDGIPGQPLISTIPLVGIAALLVMLVSGCSDDGSSTTTTLSPTVVDRIETDATADPFGGDTWQPVAPPAARLPTPLGDAAVTDESPVPDFGPFVSQPLLELP